MGKKWQIKDLIDLEYFLHDDDGGPDRPSKPNLDRRIYLDHIKPALDKEKPGDKKKQAHAQSRREIFRLWLTVKRKMLKASMGAEAVLPGAVFEEVYTALLYSVLAVGFVAGSGLAFSLLTYHGTKPLNVSVYLGVFVMGQVLLLVLLFLAWLFRHKLKILSNISIIYRFFGGALARLVYAFLEKALKNIPEEKRKNLRAALGLVRGGRAVYGALFFWPLFILAQAAGVGFNLGVLAATLLRVAGRDLAFGWESTIQLSAQSVHGLVRVAAFPWSRIFPPGTAYPTVEQIEGSKIILKEGIYHLSTQALVSWWPFLCLAVFFYGFLPRALLLAAGRMAQARALSQNGFHHSLCERLMIRMTTPDLRSRGLPGKNDRTPRFHEKTEANTSPPRMKGEGKESRGAVVLVPDDIFGQSPEPELADRVQQVFGYYFLKRIKIGLYPEADRTAVKALIGIEGENGPPAVLLLQEAWQPPIKETLAFVREVRSLLTPQSPVIVALIGKPGGHTIFTEVENEDWEIWKQEIAGMGDPGIWPAVFGDQ